MGRDLGHTHPKKARKKHVLPVSIRNTTGGMEHGDDGHGVVGTGEYGGTRVWGTWKTGQTSSTTEANLPPHTIWVQLRQDMAAPKGTITSA